ncbi:hypothetical protein GHT07_06120 [Caenimonas koreensis DSM 17982]|uniref:O-antigen ligase like membrane protein n=1 Tax=Caenimonas koreensis DSM 17982 TaxID=1121255 RepID=A0A844B141_9BURK|nr:hypothetical protein [Caenimonas koreensis]MRD46843.1 hypothetical protein [Caenimonas koreensis DSM 17982]
MIELTLVLVATAALVVMLDWRKGLAACVLIGIVQDPLRKLAPGQPVYYVLLVGVIFGVTLVRAALANVRLDPGVIHGWRKNLRLPFSFFIAVVFAQALHTLVAYNSFFMAGIGLLVWLSPIPAVVLSYQFAIRRGLQGVRRLMVLYVLIALVALSGVYLEYAGFEWRTLGEVGEGLVIYDMGTILKAHSGFFRASEMAAWHAATIACFVFILSVGKRPTLLRIVAALLLIGVLISLGMLTGRRKMLVEVTIFLCVYGILIALLQKGRARLALALGAVALVGYFGIVGLVAPDPVQTPSSRSARIDNPNGMQGYAARGRTVVQDLPQRVSDLGLQPIVYVVDRFGWLGAGLGTGSQGTNQVTAAAGINRWAAEGGLGKIAMELGIPGLLVLLWLGVALFKHLRKQLAAVAQLSTQHMRMAYGLVAFLVANLATFSIATQAYNDLFILVILGWSTGFLLAMPVLAAKGDPSIRRRNPQDTIPFGLPPGYRHPSAHVASFR